MKSFVVALCVIAVAAAVSVDNEAKTVSSYNEQNPEGQFKHGFESDNGIKESVASAVKVDAEGKSFLEFTGTNEYKNPDGAVLLLKYTADEFGYHPEADYLPTPPAPQPLPEYIQRSLEWIAAHPYDEKKQQ